MTRPSIESHRQRRQRMVAEQLEGRGISDRRVLATMAVLPRERFTPAEYRDQAYIDAPIPLGHQATISQPYIAAYMTALLELRGTERVLELGTGSGYQSALLAEVAAEVFSIEIDPALHRRSAALLRELHYDNVHTRRGDGSAGWPEEAPFDAILVSAAAPEVPAPLIDQLGEGGRLIAPIGRSDQRLVFLQRRGRKTRRRILCPVRFVPLQPAENTEPRR